MGRIVVELFEGDFARSVTDAVVRPDSIVKRLHGEYPDGVRLTRKEMKPYEARLERSNTLPNYDIVIRPTLPRCG